MTARFYYGQLDYIAQLNYLEGLAALAKGDPGAPGIQGPVGPMGDVTPAATAAASSASGYALEAKGYRDTALGYSNSASTSATLASQWASQLSTAVAGGLFSARQYAANSAQSAADAAASAASAAGGQINSDWSVVNTGLKSCILNKPTTLAGYGITDAAPKASPSFTGTVSGITAAMVGLGSVNNTADVNKPVSTAQQAALDLKATLAGPTFTGTVSGITAAMVGLGSVTNTADVNKPVSTAQQAALDLKATLASPTFTGTVTTAALTLADNLLTRAMARDCGLVYLDKGTITTASTTQNFDYTAGSHQRLQVGVALTIATSNWPPSGNLGILLIELVNGAAFAVSWPTINWVKSDGSTTTVFGSNGVTLRTSGTDWVLLWTRDAGTTVYGKVMR